MHGSFGFEDLWAVDAFAGEAEISRAFRLEPKCTMLTMHLGHRDW